jgi:hypothetical protein
MKKQFISVMLVCFCFYSISCASVPVADFSVYIPKKKEGENEKGVYYCLVSLPVFLRFFPIHVCHP